jgi:tryptophanyl-tRNA synthetase
MNKEVILTGLRSNAEFHLGNYLGAILPMVNLQKSHAGQYQLNMFVPDLHSFTTPIVHNNLYDQTLHNIKVFVASGLDINQPDTYIYRQSYIPAHSELTWVLSCFTGYGELSRMTEFKDKSQKQENVTAGLFNYPVLMAADILLYGAKWVPVGEDQRQHVEFTRDLAIRMNNKFGDIFVIPEDNSKQTEFSGRIEPIRIRSLRNPDKKMSKSVEDPAGTVLLTDNPDDAAQKVMSATTDSVGAIHYDWENQPGVTNLLQILYLLNGTSKDEVVAVWEGKSSYGELKSVVAQSVKSFLQDFQSKLSQVNHDQLMQKLEADEAKMSNAANSTLERVQKVVGLRPQPK